MTIGDNRDYISVLLYSYYTTITGWGVLLIYTRPTFRMACDVVSAAALGRGKAKPETQSLKMLV